MYVCVFIACLKSMQILSLNLTQHGLILIIFKVKKKQKTIKKNAHDKPAQIK